MMFVADNQLLLLALCFFAGCVGTAFLFRKPAGHRVWRLADLLWVVLGGLGALAAVLAGLYKADSSRLDRQIDLAYAATRAFDQDAARFRLRHCETARAADLLILCDRVEFLSASTANNADLPLFIAVTRSSAPRHRLNPFVPRPAGTDMDMAGMRDRADAFDPEPLLAFAALDDDIRPALQAQRATRPDIAADYQILAASYDDLIAQVRRLKTEWDFLQAGSGILVLQILALCMVSYAAPYRLGKSLVELR